MKPLILLSFCWILVSCSDFYMGGISHGSSRSDTDTLIMRDTLLDSIPADTVRDTVLIPADSLVVPVRYSINETLVHNQYTFHAGRTGLLEFSIRAQTIANSPPSVYGVLVCPIPLSLLFNGSPLWDSLSADSAGGLWRYYFRSSAQLGQSTRIDWHPLSFGDYSVSALILLGYTLDSAGSPALAQNIRLFEYQVIASHQDSLLESGEFFWREFRTYPGDTLKGLLASDSAIRSWIVNEDNLNAFKQTAHSPETFIHARHLHGDTVNLVFSTHGSLGYITGNPDTLPHHLRDSLYIYRAVVSN